MFYIYRLPIVNKMYNGLNCLFLFDANTHTPGNTTDVLFSFCFSGDILYEYSPNNHVCVTYSFLPLKYVIFLNCQGTQ